MAEYVEHTCGECIHSEICEHMPTLTGWDALNPAYCEAFKNAADVVERKRGRWIWDENAMDWGLGGWVCSECQEKNDNIPAKPDINPYGWVGSFYCPNCGADMREPD